MANTDLSGAPKLEQFEFISLLGVGGMSRVYKARQTLLDRVVAVKVLSRQALSSDTALKRFQVEAKLTSSLTHPNIVQVLNYGISQDGQAYLVMEYLEGQSLSDVIAEDAPISFRRFQNIFLPLLSALTQAHSKGIIHRDIKPSNIIISKSEEGAEIAKLVDFGIAKALIENPDSTVPIGLTKTGLTFGSPTYMSPEQCQGQELDGRSDIYSLACVMFETLNGSPPFTADSALDLMYKHLHEPRIRTKELSAQMEIPEVLAKAILFGLNKDVSKRPETAAKFASKLSSALNEVTLDRSPQRVMKKKMTALNSTRNRLIALGTLVVLLPLLIAPFLQVKNSDKHNRSREIIETSAKPTGIALYNRVKKQFATGKDLASLLRPCEQAIELLKTQRSSPSTLAEAYMMAASIIGDPRIISDAMRKKRLKCDLEAAQIFGTLKKDGDYLDASRNVIYDYAFLKQGAQAIKYLDNMRARDETPEAHQNWYASVKFNCLNIQGLTEETEQLARAYFKKHKGSSENFPYYEARLAYATALEINGNIKQAAIERDELLKQFISDKCCNPPGRRSLFHSVQEACQKYSPRKFAALIKLELANNSYAYSEYPADECEMRILLGETNLRFGENELARSQFLTALRIAESMEPGSDARFARIKCLESLIRITKDDPTSLKRYQRELTELIGIHG